MPDLIPTSLPRLRDFTSARVSLPTTGHSIVTSEVLKFQLAHAQARDAVHAAFQVQSFAKRVHIELPILAEASIPVFQLRTNAADRATYLRHPFLAGPCTQTRLANLDAHRATLPSSLRMAFPLWRLSAMPFLCSHTFSRSCSPQAGRLPPLALVQQGRVAIGDPIGFHLGASLSLVLIGERPGLSSPDSLGAYLTWQSAS